MSQYSPFGQWDDDDPQRPPAPPAHPPVYSPPGYAAPYFDPNDPLVSPDYAGWWNRAMAVVRRGWKPLALVQLIAMLPGLVLVTALQIYVVSASLNLNASPGTPPDLDSVLGVLAAAFAVGVLAYLLYAATTLAANQVVVTIATGGRPQAGPIVRSVLPRVLPMIGWSLLGGFITALGFLACLLPGLYFATVLTLLAPVVLFERSNAIARCFSLFHNDFGAAIARILTIGGLVFGTYLAFVLLSTLTSLLLGEPMFADPSVAGSGASLPSILVQNALSGLAGLLIGTVLPPLTVTAYADLRARREPFTTAHLLHA